MWSQFFWVDVHRAVFSELECRAILDLAADMPAQTSVLHRHTGQLVRDSGIRWLYAAQCGWVFERINAAVAKYNEVYNYEILPIDSAQLTHYAVGQEYDYHVDIGDGPMSLRKISCSVELSDPATYEGGGLVVGEDKVALGRGDMALFSSLMLHKAPKVLSGERWSLVCWILGERPLR